MLKSEPEKGISPQAELRTDIFSDLAIFDAEMTKVFDQGWIFLGHRCEAREPGRFFCSEIGCTPVVICRGTDGRLRGFVDACRICGESVALAQWGATESFACVQAHQRYNLSGQAADGGALEPIEIDDFHGLIYGSRAPREKLLDYLGPVAESWNEIIEHGVEWELLMTFNYYADANWKAYMQPGDGYHVQSLHKIFSKAIMPRAGFYGRKARVSPAYGSILLTYPPLDYDHFRQIAWRDVNSPEEVSIPGLSVLQEGVAGYIGMVFPNTLFTARNGWDFKMYQIMPRSPERTLVFNKVYCRAGLTDAQKHVIQKEQDLWSGPMGLNAQDDNLNFEWQQKALRGNTLSRLTIARHPGEDNGQAEFESPQDGEAGYRSYFKRWSRLMNLSYMPDANQKTTK
ncbi:MAG: hypothetical protein IVW54_12620 [Candidatus Binataceae bacterium]|nr:hypothetical protein [Candidatus Binataceae bacterium]